MRLGPAEVRWTGRAEGDLGPGGTFVHPVAPDVERRRRAVLDRRWSWLRQVHGARVVRVEEAGGGCGEEGDALVTTRRDVALAVLTADCAPIALASPEGVVGAVHAGWRGLVAGVVREAAQAMRAAGARRIEAALGPCIHAECYEFSQADLDRVAARLGAAVRAECARGRPALDLPSAARAELAEAGVELVHDEAVCTACSPAHYSHRARRELERQAMVVWLPGER